MSDIIKIKKEQKRIRTAQLNTRMHPKSKRKVQMDALKKGLPVEVYVRQRLGIKDFDERQVKNERK